MSTPAPVKSFNKLLKEQAIQREELRKKGIDIEISKVVNVDAINNVTSTGKYRYLVSIFGKDNRLIRNIYSNELYNSYREAEREAIACAFQKVFSVIS